MTTETGPLAAGRHPATQQVSRWFSYDHLPAGAPRHVSAMCAAMAGELLRHLPDGPELTAGLRKLLEAKDCFVRAAIGAAAASVTEPAPAPKAEIREDAPYPGFKPTTQVIAEAGINPGQPPA